MVGFEGRGADAGPEKSGGTDARHAWDDDQMVPYADSGPLSAKLLKNGILKTYKGFPHGMLTTQADTINADILAFIKA
jgi:hypothetical protein